MNRELFEKMARLQWLLHRRHMRGCAGGGPMADTTRGQGRILAVLKMKDGISTRDLSYLLGIAVSSLNELLSKLEKSGYVTREHAAQDKRIMLVTLTDKGRGEEPPEAADPTDIFACLSGEEQAAFGAYLDRMIAALQKNVGADDGETFERMQAARAHFAAMLGAHFDGGGGRRGFKMKHGGDFAVGMGPVMGWDLF
ncbi:MAG: MarR family transcriptional regulator [Oscillospiraceae bacterium]|jgi:DNA-binding MarR family transcriptional regulator|nr:MarR family transcriptional regulator [Oscillospiraceae bacterium]